MVERDIHGRIVWNNMNLDNPEVYRHPATTMFRNIISQRAPPQMRLMIYTKGNMERCLDGKYA